MGRYCWCLLGLVSCFSTGCRPLFSAAQYANGITFKGENGSVHQVGWSCPKGQRIPCPLVIHLKNQMDLGEKQFSSPQFMLKLGGEIRSQDQNSSEIVVSTQECIICVCYEQQMLTSVSIGVSKSGKSKQKITVDGKAMVLPMSMHEVLKLYGDPQHFSEDKPGEPHP